MKAWQKLALGGTAALGLALMSVSACMIGYLLGERSVLTSPSLPTAAIAPATPVPAAIAPATEMPESASPIPSHMPTSSPVPMLTPVPTATPAPTVTLTSVPNLVQQPAVGDDVLVSDVRWKVLSVEPLGSRLTSENQFIEPATTMGKFVRVRFEVENRGPNSTNFSGVEIVDNQGRAFRRSTGVFHWIPDAEECFLETLNPNVPKICTFIFDVAGDAIGLQLKVGDLKLFGNQEALIALGL